MKFLLGAALLTIVLFVGLTYGSLSFTPKEFETCQILKPDDVEAINFTNHDSVLVAASTLYEASDLKELMQGEQYRDAWSTPLNVPIVFLDTLRGKLTVLEEGGGKQTQSLDLLSGAGVRYTLRSVNKNPHALIPEFARSLGLENIIIDGISAQHPYAAMVIAPLAEAADILHTHPHLVFVPKQEALDTLNYSYGNRIFFLEYETEGTVNWTNLLDVVAIIETEELIERKRIKKGDLVLDKNALIRARLFDIVIGDWDRHAKQWGWVLQQTSEGELATPLPGDRDNAFYQAEGIIPSIISNRHLLPTLQSFTKDVDFFPGLITRFDEYFLKGIDRERFLEEAQHLQGGLTEELIEQALRHWPEQIYDLHAASIQAKIIARRNDLIEYATTFHRILSERDPSHRPLNGLDISRMSSTCFDCP